VDLPRLQRAFGAEIRRRREDAGLSQEALAFQAGLHWTYVSILERGLRNPTLGVLSQLAEALGTSMTAIVREIERRA
jgi:transcriptional regulator with XRE-family HTH domain